MLWVQGHTAEVHGQQGGRQRASCHMSGTGLRSARPAAVEKAFLAFPLPCKLRVPFQAAGSFGPLKGACPDPAGLLPPRGCCPLAAASPHLDNRNLLAVKLLAEPRQLLPRILLTPTTVSAVMREKQQVNVIPGVHGQQSLAKGRQEAIPCINAPG